MAVGSEAALCNLALAAIGQKVFIDDLTDESEAAQACNVIYATARDALLEQSEWAFAQRRVTLALAGVARDGWDLSYAVPADCIAERRITVPGVRNPGEGEWIPFAVEANDAADGRVILTDQVAAELVYTARIAAVGLFSPLFVVALKWDLAAQLALCLPVKAGVAVEMAKAARAALSTAAASNFNRRTKDQSPLSQFSTVAGMIGLRDRLWR